MKKNLLGIFTIVLLLFSVATCDYIPNRTNIITASRSVIDTGVRYIVVQRDTSKPAPIINLDSVSKKKTDSLALTKQPDTIATAAKPIEKPTGAANPKVTALTDYAKSMIGKPYVYGANTPEKGFDNSGFVNFVFNHFDIKLPKYAPAFITVGENVVPSEVMEGDIVLFSKTDSVKKVVYQVGIVVSTKGSPVSFIHASAGKMNGVGVSALSSYYQKKVMGFRRMF
ncbi:C40 family peptidase [Pedobacter arcticus]|uniref:C40 family peptidase n=1 Tax=Pedobacter arcticus TaxID=752140 RepID=UPI0003806A88|nr:NlpC/P60 family protein [Pedobacter arcticus]